MFINDNTPSVGVEPIRNAVKYVCVALAIIVPSAAAVVIFWPQGILTAVGAAALFGVPPIWGIVGYNRWARRQQER